MAVHGKFTLFSYFWRFTCKRGALKIQCHNYNEYSIISRNIYCVNNIVISSTVHNDGRETELLALDGTLPVVIRGRVN